MGERSPMMVFYCLFLSSLRPSRVIFCSIAVNSFCINCKETGKIRTNYSKETGKIHTTVY